MILNWSYIILDQFISGMCIYNIYTYIVCTFMRLFSNSFCMLKCVRLSYSVCVCGDRVFWWWVHLGRGRHCWPRLWPPSVAPPSSMSPLPHSPPNIVESQRNLSASCLKWWAFNKSSCYIYILFEMVIDILLFTCILGVKIPCDLRHSKLNVHVQALW